MTTIFARSSAPGKAGVTVYRLSGPDSLKLILELTQLPKLEARTTYFTTLRDPVTGAIIDEVLLCYFAAPASFTGEDVVEIHAHGSIAVEKILTELVLGFSSVRYAEAGEFARRAFLNSKIDLTRAEAMVDLIEAETAAQHMQAVRQMSGELEELYINWRRQLLQIMSLIEAYIDFPEEDIPEHVIDDAQDKLTNLIASIREHLDDGRKGERLRSGLRLSLLGHPNVGKSSLINLLTQREVSIVSNIAGTTRDALESHLDIGGYPLTIIDTAGIVEDTEDIIEQEGVTRARRIALDADIRLILIDATQEIELSSELKQYICEPSSIIICNKLDLLDKSDHEAKLQEVVRNLGVERRQVIAFSALQNIGMQELLGAITAIAENIANPGEAPALTRQRHRVLLVKALEIIQQLDFNDELELLAEDIRMAAAHLYNLVGRIEVDEVLGEIFSSFCIGK